MLLLLFMHINTLSKTNKKRISYLRRTETKELERDELAQ